jgi:hypothetical protein
MGDADPSLWRRTIGEVNESDRAAEVRSANLVVARLMGQFDLPSNSSADRDNPASVGNLTADGQIEFEYTALVGNSTWVTPNQCKRDRIRRGRLASTQS